MNGRRRRSRREELQEQVKLSLLLNKWLDPTCTFWTATDPVAPSVTSGAMRKKRGVTPGVPDVLVWYLGHSITIELKSRRGQCSPSQRAVREALLRHDDLAASTRQALVAKLSQTLAGFVVARSWLDETRARRIAREACEKAIALKHGRLALAVEKHRVVAVER